MWFCGKPVLFEETPAQATVVHTGYSCTALAHSDSTTTGKHILFFTHIARPFNEVKGSTMLYHIRVDETLKK